MSSKERAKPNIIGLFGLPGSGKSTLLRQLREEVDQRSFALYEGSERIAEICPGGIAALGSLSHEEKRSYREQAVRAIQQECIDHSRSAIVTGHFLFWGHSAVDHDEVWTAADANTLTHIIYLDVPSEIIRRQRAADPSRQDRHTLSASDIEVWKQAEKDGLRLTCYDHGVLMARVRDHGPGILARVLQLLSDFQLHDETHNRKKLIEKLDEVVNAHFRNAQTMLVFDADKTLGPFDSGELFWNDSASEPTNPLKQLFGSLGYSYHGFRQMMLEYESCGDDAFFENRCAEVAKRVTMYPELLQLLRLKARDAEFGIIIVTCGLSRVWSLVLEREKLSDAVQIIGSGRVEAGLIVTPESKRDLVAHLQHAYKLRVWGFGDSPLDLPMLQQADDAVVVVAAESVRSQSMDSLLESAITEDGFRARQLLLPADAEISPRLGGLGLPVVEFPDLVAQEIHPTTRGHLELIQGTNQAFSKVISTDMRDARIAGHHLREVHMSAGYFLAMNYVSEIVGLEQTPIPHVTGGHAAGYRLRHEERTSIIACMRGGEAMAFGVSKAFPHARFFHAKTALDVEVDQLKGQSRVIIVDSVINEGTTVIDFVRRVRQIYSTIRIIVVAGVAQAEAVKDTGPIAQRLDCLGRLTIVVLRVSQNKYTGSGGTDTGNRLFNTVYKKEQRRLILERSIS